MSEQGVRRNNNVFEEQHLETEQCRELSLDSKLWSKYSITNKGDFLVVAAETVCFYAQSWLRHEQALWLAKTPLSLIHSELNNAILILDCASFVYIFKTLWPFGVRSQPGYGLRATSWWSLMINNFLLFSAHFPPFAKSDGGKKNWWGHQIINCRYDFSLDLILRTDADVVLLVKSSKYLWKWTDQQI